MHERFSDATERSERIFAGMLRVLYRGTLTIPVNVAIGAIVVLWLWNSFPHLVLLAWLAAATAVCGVRLAVQHAFNTAPLQGRCNRCWAMRFTLGALASGAMWGLLALGLPAWGQSGDYVLLMLAGAGMTAGAVAAMTAYMPAYVAYSSSVMLPMAAVALFANQEYVNGIGAMVLVYLAAISLTARRSHRFVRRTVELQVDNEILKESLSRTREERDEARTDKWSTLAQLSHELRTPLNAILGFSEAMHAEYFGPMGNPRYKEYAKDVHTSGQHLLTLTEELLELSQGEAGALALQETTLDVAATIRACADLMACDAQSARVQLAVECASNLPLLRGDKTKLRRIVLNLLDNAIKFTPAGGQVTATLAVGPDNGLLLTVRDTGIGMTPDDIGLALQPFGRIESPLQHGTGGAGLGLPVCKRLVELHGGSLALASAPQQGTTVSVRFPPTRCVVAPAGAAAAA